MAWAEFRKTKTGLARRVNKKTGKTENGSWYVMGKTPSGEPICEKAGLWANVKDVKTQVEKQEVGAQKDGQIIKGAIPIDVAYREFEISIKGKSISPENTWKSYKWTMDKFIAWLSEPEQNVNMVGAVLKPYIFKFRMRIMEAHSVNGMFSIFKVIRSFFSYCVQAGYIEVNPAAKCLKGLKETKVGCELTDTQAQFILKCIDDPKYVRYQDGLQKNREEFANIVKTALLTGMREFELCKFKIEANQDGVRIGVIGKGGKYRTIPILPELWPILNKYTNRNTRQIFQGWNPGRIRQYWVRLIKRARKHMELPPRVRVHDLRHTFASNFAAGGGDLKTLQEIIGHERLATTERYLHTDENRKQEQMSGLRTAFLNSLPEDFKPDLPEA